MFSRFILFYILLSFTVAGCSSLAVQQPLLTQVKVEYPEPNRIRFEGKGAGAGIALMSTMGPVGIALGVAIDEGIAKSIQESVSNQGIDLQSEINKTLSESLSTYDREAIFEQQGLSEQLVVKRYGFKIVQGGDDLVTPFWELVLVSDGVLLSETKYPIDDIQSSVTPVELEKIKADGGLALSLLITSLSELINQLYKSQ